MIKFVRLTFLSIFTLLFHSEVFSQKETSIPSGSRHIIIEVPDSLTVGLYKAVADHLTKSGFTIINSDKDLGIIGTDRKEVKNSWEVRIAISISGSKIRFTGKQFMPGFDNSESQIEFFGAKGSMYKTCFNEVNRVAVSFPNKLVTYER
jgi:hypothetical protein